MKGKEWLDQFDVDDSELEKVLKSASSASRGDENSASNLFDEAPTFEPYSVILATVLHVQSDALYLDIGYKDEVIVFARDLHLEVANFPKVGDKIEVGFLGFDASQQPRLTCAARVSWPGPHRELVPEFEEGDRVTGIVARQMKGGLLFNCGVNVFLPASQVDRRRPKDLKAYVGQELECEVIKVDRIRRNIVVSRRKILDDERAKMATALLRRVKIGDTVTGIATHIAHFGAFVELGGLEGLVHTTDMGKEAVDHPSDVVALGDEVEVKILHIDHDKDKIALALVRKIGTTEERKSRVVTPTAVSEPPSGLEGHAPT